MGTLDILRRSLHDRPLVGLGSATLAVDRSDSGVLHSSSDLVLDLANCDDCLLLNRLGCPLSDVDHLVDVRFELDQGLHGPYEIGLQIALRNCFRAVGVETQEDLEQLARSTRFSVHGTGPGRVGGWRR